MSSRSRGLRGSCISASRMTEGLLPTGRRSCEHRQLMRVIPGAYRRGSRRRSSRAGSRATQSPATRQIGAGLPASRISNLRSGLNTRATMASVGRHHRSVSSAAARMATCRTSTGAASSTRTFAAKAQPEPAGPCREQMWLEDAGTSADPRDTRIVCDCGASLSLEELFQPGRLGACPGERPWIGDQGSEDVRCT